MRRRNKYGNVKRAGFDSKKEERVHALLNAAKRARDSWMRPLAIATQVSYELLPRQLDENGRVIERAVRYVADFVVEYTDRTEVLDVKSEITRKLPAYVIKRKLMLFRHGIRIKEV